MNIITYIKKHIVSGYTLSALLLLCVLFVFAATVHADEDQFIVRQIVGGDTTPPTTPTSLVATAISTTQIDLSWTASTDNSLTVAGYQVFRDMVFVATTTLTSYSDIDLTPSTTYAYTVTAFDNSVNISEHSATSSATTLALPTVDVEDTTIPDDGGGRAGPTTQVEYFAISPDVYSAWIQVGTNVPVKTITKWGTTADYELGSVAGPVYLTDHVIQLDGLLPNTRYVVRVEMTDARGRTLIIDNQEFTTRSLPDIFPPENISDFRATPDTSQIVLTWKNPKVDFASVRIVRSDKFFPRDPMEGEVVYEGAGERYVDTDVVPNQPYYYAAFVRDPMGNYSSGALAGARLLNPGESPFVQDLFAGIVQLPRSSIDPLLQNFVVGDIRFMQDGAELAAADSKVTLRGDRDFVIAIDYDKMPEVLKTIVVTLHDPVDSSKTFSFLLRVNKEKTAYEAHVAPLGRAGEYAFTVSILDHKKQGLISVMGSIIATMPDIFSGGRSTWFDYVKQNPIISFSLIALLMILFGMFYKIHRHKAALAATKTLSGALVVILMLTMFAPSGANAAFNKEINYQGKLTNTSNVAVSDGTYHMRFKLYTAATGGSPVWTEDRSTAAGDRITVSNGLFSVMLGSSTPLSTVDFNQTLYLGVEIGGSAGAASWDGEMTPRKKIGAVPAAVESDRVDGLSSEQFLRTDTSNSTSTASTFLTFIQSGAGKVAEFFNATLTSVLSIGQNNVGVGTTTPSAKLAVHALNGETNTTVFAVASSTASATTTLFSINNAGQVTAGSGTFTISSTGAITRLGNGTVSMTSAFLQMSSSGGDVWLQNNVSSANSGIAIKAGVSSNDPGSAIKFEAGNSERMRIMGNGLVGIGTSTPYARFSVWGAGTGTGLLANFVNNASTTIMSIFDNGRVQIGTTSANAVLTVASSTGGVATFGTSNFLEITSPLGTSNTGLSIIGSYLSGVEIEGNYQTSSGPNGFSSFSDASTLNTTVSGAGNSVWSIKSSPTIKGTEDVTEFVGFKSNPQSVASGIHSFAGTVANTSLFASDLSSLLSGTFTNFNIFKGDASSVGATINNLYGLNMGDITAGTALNYAIKTGLGLVSFGDKVGIGTTTPYAPLSVYGQVVGSYFTATSTTQASTFPYASTTALTVSGTGGLQLATGLNGPLQANAGLVSATTSIGVVYGGTGLTTAPSYGQVLVGNSSGGYTLTATSSLGISGGSSQWTTNSSDIYFSTGNVGIGTTSPYAKLSVVGQVVADYFTATSSTASTFPYASTTALSVTGTAYFPSSGIWNSSGQIGIGTTTPNSIDKISIRNSSLGSASVYGDTGGISITNSHAGASSDYTINLGYVPYPNGAAQTFYDTYAAHCFRGKSGTNANMTGITGCRISEFPWYDTTAGHFVMEDYIRIDNTNSGQIIDNYRPIMSNFYIDTNNPRSRFDYNAIERFSINDNLISANSGGVSFNNDHNMLWLNSATSQGQINLKNFSFGNQTNLSSTKLAVVATSTETDLTDIFTVASTSAGGSVTKYAWVPRTGGLGLAQLTPASTPNGVLYNDSSGNLTWNGGSSITGATVINTGNAGLTLALSVKRTAQFDSGVSSQSAITAFGRTSQSIDIVNVRDVSAGNVIFNVGFSPDYKVGVGTTTPWAKFSVNASGLTAGVPQFVVGSSTATHLIVANGGNVGVGTTTPWRKFSVTGTVAMSGLTSSGTGNAVCITTGKDITDAGGASCTPSSERFKENIETLTPGLAISKLNQLRVVSFDYKEGFYSPEDSPHAYGMIAEEVQEVDPYLVDLGYDGLPRTLQFEKILALTVQAVQELSQGGGGFANLSLDSVITALGNLGMHIVDGIAYLQGLFVETLTVGTPEKPTGITLYDEVTGDPYCLKIVAGKMKSVRGECKTKENNNDNGGGGSVTPVEPGEVKQTEIVPLDDEGGGTLILPGDTGEPGTDSTDTETDPGAGTDSEDDGEDRGSENDESGDTQDDSANDSDAPSNPAGDTAPVE